MPKGRPRAFDTEKALDLALRVFWRKGYEGTSLLDLTEAMGINRPSLYAAFGNKEALFRKALDRYIAGPAAHTREALEESTARAVAERLLRGTADVLSDPRNPPGCLAVQGRTLVWRGGRVDPAGAHRTPRGRRVRASRAIRNARSQKATCRQKLNPPIWPAMSRPSPREWRSKPRAVRAATRCNGSSIPRCGLGRRDSRGPGVDSESVPEGAGPVGRGASAPSPVSDGPRRQGADAPRSPFRNRLSSRSLGPVPGIQERRPQGRRSRCSAQSLGLV